MRRMRISSYLRAAFVAGEAPCARTIRAGIDHGSIPGERIGGVYFVYVNDDLSLAEGCAQLSGPVTPINEAAAKIFKAAGML